MWKTHKKQIILTLALTLLPALVGLLLWQRLPDRIPTHFGVDDQPNGYSSRAFAVLGLPGILAALELFCVFATSADPRRRGIDRRMLGLLLWIIPLMSIGCCGVCYATALGYPVQVGTVLCLLLGAIVTVLGNYMPKCGRNYSVGIRTRWALEDPENWRCTHRLAGFTFSLGGLLTMVLAFLAPLWCLASILAAALLPVLYSYLYYLKHKEAV